MSPLAEKMLYEAKNPGKTLWIYHEKYDSGSIKYTKIKEEKDLGKFGSRSVCYLTEDLGDSFVLRGGLFGDPSKDPIRKKFNDAYFILEVPRHDPDLVRIVEELGSDKASGNCSKLEIIDIGENLYHIDEYDGYETVITDLPGNYWQ